MSEAIFEFDKEDNLNNLDNLKDDDDLAQFDLSLKKKKKKKVKENKEDLNMNKEINKDENDENDKNDKNENDEKDEKDNIIIDNDQEDYDYVHLLDRFYTVLREKNPSLACRKRQVIPPPILHSVGKKTMWSNFAVIVGILKRTVDHVQSYINYELSTDSSIDGNMRLIIKGKYSSKNLEPVLKKYIIEYVSCSGCKSHETSLIKDPITRVSFIKCDTCKSSRSINAIKAPCRV